jgi:endonuclease/exonuclease/phosphatase family metal-dependent hydrolase
VRIATYNVEWFNRLFDDDDKLINDDSWSGRWDVTKAQQTAALGAVFQVLDADAIMIIEAPDTSPNRSTVQALGEFSARFSLRTSAAIVGFANDTQQEIALLYDPDVIKVIHDPLGDDTFPCFDQTFAMDLDIDAAPDLVRWSKPPLELALDGPAGPLRIIGVHAKSKAPHGATSDAEAIRISIENRRKQLAQCIWLRGRVDTHLGRGDDLIILGDFNDGPGLDEYEKLFGRSSVEVVLGEGSAAQMYDPHARMALSRRLGASPTTSRFKRKGQPYLQALLDYIMVSPGLRAKNPNWQIWHPFDHPACYENKPLRKALLQASDHFPVVLELPDIDA